MSGLALMGSRLMPLNQFLKPSLSERLGRLRKVSSGRRPLRRFIMFETISVMVVAVLMLGVCLTAENVVFRSA
jgi:hypothetical protein